MLPITNNKKLFFDLAKSKSLEPVFTKAQSLGVQIGPANIQVEAVYDPLKNVIYVSGEDFKNPTRNTKRSTAHELVHALEFSHLKGKPESVRKIAVEDAIVAMTETEYVRHVWDHEVAAERFAWRCETEYVMSGRGSLSPTSVTTILDRRIEDFATSTKSDYEKKARDIYRAATTAIAARSTTQPATTP